MSIIDVLEQDVQWLGQDGALQKLVKEIENATPKEK